jgi:hypothetical protein
MGAGLKTSRSRVRGLLLRNLDLAKNEIHAAGGLNGLNSIFNKDDLLCEAAAFLFYRLPWSDVAVWLKLADLNVYSVKITLSFGAYPSLGR